MTRVNMAKYGFVRCPAEDFSDDGNRFQVYKVGTRVRVTKLVADGEAYIDGTIQGTKLPYEVYSKLPHYSAVGKLNGVSLAGLTDKDLQDLYEDCLKYEAEYNMAENTIVMPTLEEIKEQCARVQAKAMQELTESETAIGLHIMALARNLREWEWTEIRKYLLALENRIKTFDPEKYPQNILGKSHSIAFCRPDCSDLKDSWYYVGLREKLELVKRAK